MAFLTVSEWPGNTETGYIISVSLRLLEFSSILSFIPTLSTVRILNKPLFVPMHRRYGWNISRFLCVWLTLHTALTASSDVFVDDNGVDPVTGSSITYTPPGAWSEGQNCTTCLAKPDPSVAFDGTWHDCTFLTDTGSPVNITFQFSGELNPCSFWLVQSSDHAGHPGSGIRVYCILAPPTQGLVTNSDMTFYIDGERVGAFTQIPTRATQYTSTVVYQNMSMPDSLHTLVLQNGTPGSQIQALALFDYIVYT